MGPQFFQTRMGQRYYEVTAPKIATELARLADNVAVLNETLARVLESTGGNNDGHTGQSSVSSGTGNNTRKREGLVD